MNETFRLRYLVDGLVGRKFEVDFDSDLLEEDMNAIDFINAMDEVIKEDMNNKLLPDPLNTEAFLEWANIHLLSRSE